MPVAPAEPRRPANQAATPTIPAPRSGPRPGPPVRRPASGPVSGGARAPKPGPASRRPAAPAAPALPAAGAAVTPGVSAEAPAQAQVQLLGAPPEAAVDRADEAVDLLLDTGRAPEQILVLTVAGAHPWQEHEESFGADRYWAQLEEAADVFYARADACPAVRREAVVLAVDGGDASRVAAAVAAAKARATHLLVVCAEPGSVAL